MEGGEGEGFGATCGTVIFNLLSPLHLRTDPLKELLLHAIPVFDRSHGTDGNVEPIAHVKVFRLLAFIINFLYHKCSAVKIFI